MLQPANLPIFQQDPAPGRGLRDSDAVVEAADTGPPGAIRTAEHPPLRLDSVADDLAPAVRALRRQRMNRALETVERMCRTSHRHVKGLVVVVAANTAGCHVASLC